MSEMQTGVAWFLPVSIGSFVDAVDGSALPNADADDGAGGDGFDVACVRMASNALSKSNLCSRIASTNWRSDAVSPTTLRISSMHESNRSLSSAFKFGMMKFCEEMGNCKWQIKPEENGPRITSESRRNFLCSSSATASASSSSSSISRLFAMNDDTLCWPLLRSYIHCWASVGEMHDGSSSTEWPYTSSYPSYSETYENYYFLEKSFSDFPFCCDASDGLAGCFYLTLTIWVIHGSHNSMPWHGHALCFTLKELSKQNMNLNGRFINNLYLVANRNKYLWQLDLV